MPQDPASGGIISEDELNRLVELFRQFEGAIDPLSVHSREIEWEFNSFIEQLYSQKVGPTFSSLTLAQFRSHARNYCRMRVSKETPPFPCP